MGSRHMRDHRETFQYKGYVCVTRSWQPERDGRWVFDVSIERHTEAGVKTASNIVGETEYFDDKGKAAAAARLWAESYIDGIERGEHKPWR